MLNKLEEETRNLAKRVEALEREAMELNKALQGLLYVLERKGILELIYNDDHPRLH